MPPKKKEKIPPPGKKNDQYTNFMSKMKWKAALQKSQLEIPDKNIRGPGSLSVCNALAKNKQIVTIDFSNNHLGDQGAINLAQALKLNELIQNINISCNEITDIGGIALASAFIPCANPTGQPSQWNRTVWYLNLSGNLLKDDTLLAFNNAISCHKDFSRLDVSWNNIGPLGNKSLMRTMSRNNTCSIIISNNNIQDEGAKYLCEAWKRHGGKGAQSYLNLYRNNLGNSSGEYIGDLLENNNYITDVNLAMNTLGGKGIVSIMNRISPPFQNVIRTLNLSENYFGDEGAERVAIFIGSNPPTLERLNINTNNITDKGGASLMKSLKTNTHLLFFLAANNDYGAQTTKYILEIIEIAKVIKVIDVRKSKLTDEMCRQIGNTATKDLRVDYGSYEEEFVFNTLLLRLGEIQQRVNDEEERAKLKKKRGKKKK
eukprot:Tbor_TRINITY_DN5203_c2_g1::TRINITY_DN5203_c2_g1_i1::g.16242::m.16242